MDKRVQDTSWTHRHLLLGHEDILPDRIVARRGANAHGVPVGLYVDAWCGARYKKQQTLRPLLRVVIMRRLAQKIRAGTHGAKARPPVNHVAAVHLVGPAGSVEHTTEAAIDEIKGTKGQTVEPLSADQRALWMKQIQPVLESWEKSTPNGAQVLAAYRKELAALNAEPAHP